MKNHKIIISVLALLLLLNCTFIPASAASNSGACGKNAFWSFDSQTATLTISGTGAIDGYEILIAVNGSYSFTEAAPWKPYASEIKSVVIGEGITSIGESAFCHFDNLESIKLPSTLTMVENFAFARCGHVDRVIIPESVRYIGCNAFLGKHGETPYIYFLGDAPRAKDQSSSGHSFSKNTTLYYIPGTAGWSGSNWNGYKAELWNGADFIDPLFKDDAGDDFEHDDGGTPGPPTPEPDWTPDILANRGELVEVRGTKNYSYAYEVIDAVNTLRLQNGLPALNVDDKLMDVAMQRAAECSIYYSHTRPNDTSCLDIFPSATAKGENIAAGQTSPSSVMDDWRNSPGHYANMVDADYTSIGVGCFCIDGHYYWAQSFTNGGATSHIRSDNVQSTISVPVSSNHFILRSNSDPITVKVGETFQLPIQIINSGFHNTPTTIQAEISSCNSPSIVAISEEPLTITGKHTGSGTVTVSFENGLGMTYAISVTLPYDDVPGSSWYYDAVVWADSRKLIENVSQTTFGATLPMSRGMTAELLYRLEGSPAGTWPNRFLDVTSEHTAAINWSASVGFMSGYGDGIFGPEDTLTREQMATILFRYARYKGIDTSPKADISRYSDAMSVNSYALDAIRWANYEGLLVGNSSTTLAPTKKITRAEAAAIFMRFCNKFDV